MTVGGWRRFGHKELTTRWRFCPACCSREKAGDAGLAAPCGAVAAPAGPSIFGGEALEGPPAGPLLGHPPRRPGDSAAHSHHRPGQRSSPQAARNLRLGPAQEGALCPTRCQPALCCPAGRAAAPDCTLTSDCRPGSLWGMARLNPEAPRSAHRTEVPLRHPMPGPGLREGSRRSDTTWHVGTRRKEQSCW